MKNMISFSILLFFSTSMIAQKIPQARKEAMFKTPAYWQKFHDDRLKIAPARVIQQINQFNTDAVTKGYTFRIAYTSKWDIPLALITGGRVPNINSPTYHPNPAYRNLPIRLNTVHITATVNDQSVDMRDYGIITPVRDQRNCGSCWAFGTIAILETGWLLKNGGDASAIDLAEQQVLNCTSGSNCSGGWNNDAARFVCEHRVATESNYHYIAMDSSCGMGNNSSSVYKGRRWDWVGSSITELKQAILDHGSVSTTIWVSDELHNYAGGVYNLDDPPPFGQCNHVIQMIGWDDARQAWLIKNSWGTGWGEGGFAWIKYNTNYIGSHAVWIEAETTGDLNVIVNPPNFNNGSVNFSTADYNTLRSLYSAACMFRVQSRQNHKVLDCDDPVIGSGDKGHKMQQWSSHGQIFAGSDGHNQEWFFIEAGKRGEKPVYKIFNYGFNDFLQANAGNPRCENGNGLDNQLWYLMPQESKALVKIKSVGTGKCIQVPAGNNNDGGLIEMANESTGTNQLFDLDIATYNPNIELADYKVMPKHHDGSCLDLTAGNLTNGTGLQIWHKMDHNSNQEWKLTFDGNSRYFRFHPKTNDNKSMEVSGISMDNGARVGIWDTWDGYNQDWLFIRIARENDKFIIFNRNSGKCLDVSGGATADGTFVQQWEFVNGDNQKWKLEKVN